MHEEPHAYGHHRPSDPESSKQGYEITDIQIRITLWSGLAVVVMTFIAYVVSTFVVRYSNAQPPISDYDAPPIAIEARSQPFAPGVRLQVEPPAALHELRAKQHEVAATYGVVSAEPEIYRIPVDTAIDIVAQRGLPAFPTLTPAESAGAARENL